jgi:uncharacterized protein with NRDE domain
MCLIAWAWQSHPRYDLIVAANRDEFYARPSAAIAHWVDAPQVIAGRDLKAGGTWMGVTTGGRFAAITNFRDPNEALPNARSRGELVAAYLTGSELPMAFVERIRAERRAFRGFNLIVADNDDCIVYESRFDCVHQLSSGLYALSNGRFAEPWPKARALQNGVLSSLDRNNIESDCMLTLSSSSHFADADLPNTGIPLERERALSAIHVHIPGLYGTRSSTFLSRDQEHIEVAETQFDEGVATSTLRIAALRQINTDA